MDEIQILNNEPMNLQEELELKNMEISELKFRLDKVITEMNQFSYIVSHDLQSPLRMITGFLELLEKKHGPNLEDDAKQYIRYSVESAVKMRRLIFDLLDLSRLNLVVSETTKLDLNEILKEVKTKFSQTIDDSKALITNDLMPVIRGSKKQILSLFDHLIDNALKFTNNEKILIIISVKKENGFWVIGVHDNGIGIDAAYFEKIFIVFRRLHSDETKYKGTGIGLAICKKIIELHGGTIWVESEKEKGSSFYFKIPE